jgi:ribonuclease D
VLGVDTEFMLMPYYRPNLEVLQISSPEVMAAIDVQKVGVHLKPLVELMCSKEVILHSCQADLQIILDLTNKFKLPRRLPVKVYDTQIAAAYLGYAPMIAFKKLLLTMFGYEMDKSDTLTDWSRRPLTANQIKYAINDVRHLHALRNHLNDELRACGRLEWCEEEMACLTNPTLFAPHHPSDAWRAIFPLKKVPSGSVELAVSASVCQWREEAALAKNMLPGLLLKNEAVVALGALKPTEPGQLRNIQGIKPKTLQNHSRHILAAVQRGVETAQEDRPLHRFSHKDGGRLKEGLFNLLNSRVQSLAFPMNISPFHLCPRQEVFDLASVSEGALERVMQMKEEHFRPVAMVSNMMGVRFDLLPPALNTFPTSMFATDRVCTPVTLPSGHVVSEPYTEDEEVEMLLKLKVLSGWRRKLVGDDLLNIARGQSLAWDDASLVSSFDHAAGQGQASGLSPEGVRQVQEWVGGLTKQEMVTLRTFVREVQLQVAEREKNGEHTEEKNEEQKEEEKEEGMFASMRREFDNVKR